MELLRKAFRLAATMFLAAAPLAPQVAVANHYILDCGQPCNPPGPFLYIGNLTSHDVAVIDTGTDTLAGKVDIGQAASAIAVSPLGDRIYAANAQNLVTIDAATLRPIASLEYGAGNNAMGHMVIDPTGSRLFVSDPFGYTITTIDTTANRVAGFPLRAWGNQGIATLATDPARGLIYTSECYSDSVGAMDPATQRLVAVRWFDNPFTDPPATAGDFAACPSEMVLAPSADRLYVATPFTIDPASGQTHLSVLDAATLSVIARVPVGRLDPRDFSTIPYHIAMNPAGTRLYLSNGAVVDTSTLRIVGHIPRFYMGGMVVNAAGTRIYQAVSDPPGVKVVDAESGEVLRTIPLDGHPFGMALAPR
jgi:DNA-binding beta-propeller fold protein YncE